MSETVCRLYVCWISFLQHEIYPSKQPSLKGKNPLNIFLVFSKAGVFILLVLDAFAWPIEAHSFQARRHKNAMQGLNLFVLLWWLPQTSSAAGLTGTEDRRKKEGFRRNGWTIVLHYVPSLDETGSHVTLGMLMLGFSSPTPSCCCLWFVASVQQEHSPEMV